MQNGDQSSIRAVYMRGGTSRALIFRREDLPVLDDPRDMRPWNPIFVAATGSPDPHHVRQLDGMGGGISSLSKIAVVGLSSRPDADIDYTFGQVAVDTANVGYKGNCGNISSAVGPFAVDEGLVSTSGDTATVRIHNTNTGKIIHSTFPLANGKAAVRGDMEIQGVAGTGAPVKLSFLDPGGASTGKLFPTGKTRESLEVPGFGTFEVSLVDAANPVVMAQAAAFGMSGAESPAAIAADATLMSRLKALRVAAALAMGLAKSEDEARTIVANLPLVALISDPSTVEGAGRDADISVRMISSDIPHKATPLTAAMCVAVAAQIDGTLVHQLVGRHPRAGKDMNLAHPGGILRVSADVSGDGVDAVAKSAIVYRTARRLMDGRVYFAV